MSQKILMKIYPTKPPQEKDAIKNRPKRYPKCPSVSSVQSTSTSRTTDETHPTHNAGGNTTEVGADHSKHSTKQKLQYSLRGYRQEAPPKKTKKTNNQNNEKKKVSVPRTLLLEALEQSVDYYFSISSCIKSDSASLTTSIIKNRSVVTTQVEPPRAEQDEKKEQGQLQQIQNDWDGELRLKQPKYQKEETFEEEESTADDAQGEGNYDEQSTVTSSQKNWKYCIHQNQQKTRAKYPSDQSLLAAGGSGGDNKSVYPYPLEQVIMKKNDNEGGGDGGNVTPSTHKRRAVSGTRLYYHHYHHHNHHQRSHRHYIPIAKKKRIVGPEEDDETPHHQENSITNTTTMMANRNTQDDNNETSSSTDGTASTPTRAASSLPKTSAARIRDVIL